MMTHRKNYDDDNFPTDSSREQKKTEDGVIQYYYIYRQKQSQMFGSIKLLREFHIQYCLKGLSYLNENFSYLDASRPWLCYWMLHALDLLDHQLSDDLKSRVIDFLGRRCQDPNGGFGGGPGQLAHLAPTYASVLSLCIINTEEAFNVIDRVKLKQFLISLKDDKSKGFRMHKDGEIDVRGSYTALVVANLLDIMDEEVTRGVDEYILNCQTFEGGIGSFPGNEAHGGYAFCGLAAMMLLKKSHLLDLESLTHWCARRQMEFEGGFQGRTNKLVDACYSFWMGATFPLLKASLATLDSRQDADALYKFMQWSPPENVPRLEQINSCYYDSNWKLNEAEYAFTENTCFIEEEEEQYPQLNGEWFFDETALQEYLLLCCQSGSGGLYDKPGKSRDFYHTCYALSGLSVSQHQPGGTTTVLGDPSNLLKPTNPIINICTDKVESVLKYFGNRNAL